MQIKEDFHRELQVIFRSRTIALYVGAKRYIEANNLLDQEETDSKIHTQVVTYLFEEIHVAFQENKKEKALSDLQSVIEHLESCKHLEAFKALQTHLLLLPSAPRQAHLKALTSLIKQLPQAGSLSAVASYYSAQRHLLCFEVCLDEEDFVAAKECLTQPMPQELHSALCQILCIFLINRGEERRRNTPLEELRTGLQSLNVFFAAPQFDIVQSYVDFLIHLESAKKTRELRAYEEASQSLSTIFEKLKSIHYPIPASLKMVTLPLS